MVICMTMIVVRKSEISKARGGKEKCEKLRSEINFFSLKLKNLVSFSIASSDKYELCEILRIWSHHYLLHCAYLQSIFVEDSSKNLPSWKAKNKVLTKTFHFYFGPYKIFLPIDWKNFNFRSFMELYAQSFIIIFATEKTFFLLLCSSLLMLLEKSEAT